MRRIKTKATINDPVQITTAGQLQQAISPVFNDTGRTTTYVVAYLDYRVLIGKFENNQFLFYQDETFEPKFLQKLRVFNQKQEFLLWRQGEHRFNSRLRVDELDNENNEQDIVVVAEQVLWGTQSKNLATGWSKLTESRGTILILPFDSITVDDSQKRVKIKTHHYIEYNEIGQAGYVDSRFVEFITGSD